MNRWLVVAATLSVALSASAASPAECAEFEGWLEELKQERAGTPETTKLVQTALEAKPTPWFFRLVVTPQKVFFPGFYATPVKSGAFDAGTLKESYDLLKQRRDDMHAMGGEQAPAPGVLISISADAPGAVVVAALRFVEQQGLSNIAFEVFGQGGVKAPTEPKPMDGVHAFKEPLAYAQKLFKSCDALAGTVRGLKGLPSGEWGSIFKVAFQQEKGCECGFDLNAAKAVVWAGSGRAAIPPVSHLPFTLDKKGKLLKLGPQERWETAWKKVLGAKDSKGVRFSLGK